MVDGSYERLLLKANTDTQLADLIVFVNLHLKLTFEQTLILHSAYRHEGKQNKNKSKN